MLESTITFQRRQLTQPAQRQNTQPRVVHVNFDLNPWDVCPRSALFVKVGGQKEYWHRIGELAGRASTLLGSPGNIARSVFAHSYALTAAHLAWEWDLPFDGFTNQTGMWNKKVGSKAG
jgi:hypothetical protein